MTSVEELKSMHLANRERADAEVERRLVRLRGELFARREQQKVERFPIQPGAPDGREVGLPSVTPGELTVERLRAAMISHGVLHVKGLFQPAMVQTMRGAIDSALAAQEASFTGAPLEKTVPWFEPSDLVIDGATVRNFGREDGGVIAVDSPRGLYQLLDIYYRLQIDSLLTGYFGERPALSGEKTTLRRMPPAPRPGEWHQDGRFLGADIRSLNLWVALSDCPAMTAGGPPLVPGIELVASRLHRIVPTGTDGVIFDWSVSDALVRREFADQVVRPQLAAGDALFFDHFSLHRTWRCEGMRHGRYAVESWFFAPSCYPNTQTGIYV